MACNPEAFEALPLLRCLMMKRRRCWLEGELKEICGKPAPRQAGRHDRAGLLWSRAEWRTTLDSDHQEVVVDSGHVNFSDRIHVEQSRPTDGIALEESK